MITIYPMVCDQPQWLDTQKSNGPRSVAKAQWCNKPKPDGFIEIESRIKKQTILDDCLDLFIIDSFNIH